MAKRLLTENEILAAVREIVDASEEVRADRLQIGISSPCIHEIDADGCNWDIQYISNAAGHETLVMRAIAQVRSQYNLIGRPPGLPKHYFRSYTTPLADRQFQGFVSHTIEGESAERERIYQAGRFASEQAAIDDANSFTAKYIEEHEFGPDDQHPVPG